MQHLEYVAASVLHSYSAVLVTQGSSLERLTVKKAVMDNSEQTGLYKKDAVDLSDATSTILGASEEFADAIHKPIVFFHDEERLTQWNFCSITYSTTGLLYSNLSQYISHPYYYCYIIISYKASQGSQIHQSTLWYSEYKGPP